MALLWDVAKNLICIGEKTKFDDGSVFINIELFKMDAVSRIFFSLSNNSRIS